MSNLLTIKKIISLAGLSKLLLMLFLGFISGLAGICLMGSAAWIISYAALHPPLYALTLGITCVRFFGISRAAARYLMRLFSHRLAFRCFEKLQLMIYTKMCRELPLKASLTKQGQYMQQLSKDAELLRDFYLRWLLPVLSTGMLTLCLCLWLREISPASSALVCFVYGIHIILPVIKINMVKRNEPVNIYRDTLTDVSEGRDELIMSGRQNSFMAKLDNGAVSYGEAANAQQSQQEITSACLDIIRQISFVLYLSLLIQAIGNGTLEPRWLGVWILLLLGLYIDFAELTVAAFPLLNAVESAMRILDKPQQADIVESSPLDSSSEHILSAENISFSYSKGYPVFSTISFNLSKGESMAVRGDSGSGKTTLAELLLKLYPTDHGEIALFGTPYSNLSADIIRSYFSASIQQCHIFSDSIRDNFTRLHPGITDEKIWQALDTACLGNDVSIMPMKLDEPMGENGSRLSGGQRNRLLTALAIASNAPCLILDEPTDGLDKITGAQLIENIIAHIHQNGKTLILITHDAEAASKFPRELLLSQP